MDFVTIIFRTAFFYLYITIMFRIMGKREVGQLSIFDLIVSMLMAELAAISIENYKDSILFALVPVTVVVLLQVLFSVLSLKNQKIRDFMDGEPSLIIKEGRLCFQEMSKQRYNLNDLLLQLRNKSIASIEEVEYAFLEANGNLSIFPYKRFQRKQDFPLPLILDGKVQEQTLQELHKNKAWLDRLLLDQGLQLDDIFYAFYKSKKAYIIKRSELL